MIVGAYFIWDADNGSRGLKNFLVNEHGLDLTGWSDLGASDISDDGRTIVGSATNPSGFTEAWMAILPEPGPPIPSMTPLAMVFLWVLLVGVTIARGRQLRARTAT